MKHVQALQELVDREKINCDYTVTKAIDVQLSKSYFQKLKAGYEHLVAGGCTASTRVQAIGADEAERVSSTSQSQHPKILKSDAVLRCERCPGMLYL